MKVKIKGVIMICNLIEETIIEESPHKNNPLLTKLLPRNQNN